MSQGAVEAKVKEIQTKMEAEVAEIKKIESEYTKIFGAKQQLQEKKSENEMVLTEISLMGPEANLYKLVGPIMAKQDVSDGKASVQARIEYIAKEIARMDGLEADFQGKVEEKRNAIIKLQGEYRTFVQ